MLAWQVSITCLLSELTKDRDIHIIVKLPIGCELGGEDKEAGASADLTTWPGLAGHPSPKACWKTKDGINLTPPNSGT